MTRKRPGTIVLPVRCCCTPSLVLGVLDNLPRDILDDRRRRLHIHQTTEWKRDTDPPSFVDDSFEIHLEQYFDNAGGWEYAIKSEERPLEFWRALPDFRELNYPLEYAGTWRVWDEILAAGKVEALRKYSELLIALESRLVHGDPSVPPPQGILRG